MYIGQWALVLGSHFLYFESQLYLLSLSDCPIYFSLFICQQQLSYYL